MKEDEDLTSLQGIISHGFEGRAVLIISWEGGKLIWLREVFVTLLVDNTVFNTECGNERLIHRFIKSLSTINAKF